MLEKPTSIACDAVVVDLDGRSPLLDMTTGRGGLQRPYVGRHHYCMVETKLSAASMRRFRAQVQNGVEATRCGVRQLVGHMHAFGRFVSNYTSHVNRTKGRK